MADRRTKRTVLKGKISARTRGDTYASAQKFSIQHIDRDWKKKITSEL